MYGIFDIKYYVSWSKHMERKYMRDNGIKYAIQPTGRDKGCLEKVIKLGRRNVLRIMNKN